MNPTTRPALPRPHKLAASSNQPDPPACFPRGPGVSDARFPSAKGRVCTRPSATRSPRRRALLRQDSIPPAWRAAGWLPSSRQSPATGYGRALRPNTSTAITDSLIWSSLPSRCRSTRNLRKRLIRSFRTKPGLASTRSSCRRAASGSVSPVCMVPVCLPFSAACNVLNMFSTWPDLLAFPLPHIIEPNRVTKHPKLKK